MNWRNLPDDDYFLFARSYHTAARKLVSALGTEPGSLLDLDLCPVISMYRHAVELHLKVLILGDGGNFLETKPDELSIHKTRSLSWLAQFVVRIVSAVGWEEQFRCEGIDDLADFKAVIDEVNAIDPSFHTFRAPAYLDIQTFTKKLDALLDMLSSTADALAAAWDVRSDVPPEHGGNDGSRGSTIQ